MKFNLIGFDFNKYKYAERKKCCVIHPGNILIPKIDEPDTLWCTQCGTHYLENEAANVEGIQSEYGPNSKPHIISAKKPKKYYDKQGNEITDPSLIQDIMEGRTVVSYQEDLPTK